MNKISVVTITYNNFEELQLTLKSVENIEEVSSLIINGGSCEKTKKFLENSSIKSISEVDQGISDAFNKGVKLAECEAIVFLNSGDQLIDKQYYQDAIKILNEEPTTSFIYSDITFKDSLAGNIELKYKEKSLGRGMPYFHQTLIVKADVFRKIGSFNLKFKVGMDYDFVVRMLKENDKGKYIERSTVLMDGSGVSFSNEGNGIKECFRSLRENKMPTLENWIGITTRYSLYKVRMIALSLGAQTLIKKIKYLKYRKQ